MAKAKKKETRGERNARWIEEYCRVPEGKLVGQPVKLRPFQRKLLTDIFDAPQGCRRAIVSFGRKNGKTALAAFLLLLVLAGPEAKPSTQAYSVAQSRDQAAILFALAMKVVLQSPKLKSVISIRETKKELFVPKLQSLYRALSSESTTALGLSPRFVVYDELGQVRGSGGKASALYDALETAVAAQEDPLSIIISTQAATDSDLLSLLIDDAKTGADPRTVLCLYTADQSLDPFSEEAVKQANPAYGVFQNATETMAMAADAQRMPSRENEYRNLILNQRVEATSPFINQSIWQANAGKPEDWRGKDVYIGLDLSKTTDLTSMTLMHRNANEEVFSVHQWCWLPDSGLAEKSRSDRVPYDQWHKAGFLQTTPGKTIDYAYIAATILEISQNANIVQIAFDSWKMDELKKCLVSIGLHERWIEDHTHAFRQGFGTFGGAVNAVERLILDEKLRHGGNPLLTMCVNNVKVVSDASPTQNRKFVKHTDIKRIDCAVTLAMCSAVITDYELSKPKFVSYLETEEPIFF